MAFLSTDYSTADAAAAAAFARNQMLVIPENRLETASAVIWTSLGNTTDPDESAVGFAASRLFDEFPHKTSKPDSALATWYVAIDFGAAGITLDALAILIKSAVTLTVSVEIANDAIFTAPVEIASVASTAVSGQSRRIGFYDLQAAGDLVTQQYTTLQFMRIKFVGAAGAPEIAEVFAGARAQMLENPLTPFNPKGNESSTSVFQARGGAARVYEFFKGRGAFTANFRTRDLAEFAPLEDAWKRSARGTKHLIVAACPVTEPNESLLMRIDPPDFFFPVQVFEQRQGGLTFIEQGPPFRESER